MKLKVFAVLVSICTALAVSAVFGQEQVRKPWGIKVGVLRPDSTAWRDESRDYWFLGGLDYTFRVAPDGSENIGSLEYGSGRYGNRMWSLQGLYRLRGYANGEKTSATYYGAGFGIYSAKVKTADDVEDTVTRPGIPILAGVDLSGGMFVELKYHFVFGKSLGRKLSGFTMAVGYRF
ncbi:MAG: hypothetical protein ACP5R4_03660 [Armatimonadota bacterium]